MKKIFKILLYTSFGYFAGALLSYILITEFSGNTHDRQAESVVTALFVGGPFFALCSLVFGLVRSRKIAPK